MPAPRPLLVPVLLLLLLLMAAAAGAVTLEEFRRAFNSVAPRSAGCTETPLPATRLEGDYGCYMTAPGGTHLVACTYECGPAAEAGFAAALSAAAAAVQGGGECMVRSPQFCAYFVVAVEAAGTATRSRIASLIEHPVGPSVAGKYYLAFGDRGDFENVGNMAGVTETFVLPAAYKVAATLMDDRAAGMSTEVNVGLSPGFSSRNAGTAADLANFWDEALAGAGVPQATLSAPSPDEIVLNVSHAGITAAMRHAAVMVVADQPEAFWLDMKDNFTLSNNAAVQVLQGGWSQTAGDAGLNTPFYEMGITGEGQIVGLADSGLDMQHCTFSEDGNPIEVTQPFPNVNSPTNDWTVDWDTNHRKVVSYYAHADAGVDAGGRDHGTHVAGSVAGSFEDGDGTFSGAAPDAQLTFFDIGVTGGGGLDVPQDLSTSIFRHGYDTGARIHTNSWGSNNPGYTSFSRDVDKFMADNDDFLVLVAAGNSGRDGPLTVGSPATAKNCVAVGATSNTAAGGGRGGFGPADGPSGTVQGPDAMAPFSSLGPTVGGRIKPDVTAPGAPIVSTSSGTGCGSVDLQGTSMATPLTAGTAALMREYFMEGKSPYGGFVPSGAMLKATLIHSGRPMLGQTNWPGTDTAAPNNDMTNGFGPPSIMQGWGRVDASNVLPFGDSAGAFTFWARGYKAAMTGRESESDGEVAMVAAGEEDVHELEVESGGSFLKVTMVWTDPPGAVNAANVLVNNLDTWLEDPSGVRHNPMTLNLGGDGGPPNVGGPMQGTDDINPVEQIQIAAAAAGTWKLHVVGTAVPEGPQKYAVIATGQIKPDGGGGFAAAAATVFWWIVVLAVVAVIAFVAAIQYFGPDTVWAKVATLKAGATGNGETGERPCWSVFPKQLPAWAGGPAAAGAAEEDEWAGYDAGYDAGYGPAEVQQYTAPVPAPRPPVPPRTRGPSIAGPPPPRARAPSIAAAHRGPPPRRLGGSARRGRLLRG
eukprot:SAG22_NODE_80_length_21788_cov_9.742542_1_plen_978_part_10